MAVLEVSKVQFWLVKGVNNERGDIRGLIMDLAAQRTSA